MSLRFERVSGSGEEGKLACLLRSLGLADGLIVVASCSSTNDLARVAVLTDQAPSVLAITATQTKGRGRRGAQWEDVPGSALLMSLAWRPLEMPVDDLPFLSLAGAASVALAAASLGVDARVKWPNDVWVGPRKLAGVLAESIAGSEGVDLVVLGMGINILATPPLTGGDVPAPISLQDAGAHPLPTTLDFAGAVATHLARFVPDRGRPNRAAVLSAVREHNALAGGGVRVRLGEEVVEADGATIADDGSLELRMADGTRRTISDSRATVRPHAPTGRTINDA